MPTIQFSREMKKLGRAVDNSGTAITRRIAKSTLKHVVWGTYVDEGTARSNWRIGIHSRPQGIIEPYHRYPKGSGGDGMGHDETANARAAISVGIATINRLRGSFGGGLKRALYLVNNVEGEHFANAFSPNAFDAIDRFVATELRGFDPFRPSYGG